MTNKNVTASSFNTFISVLRDEQKIGYMLTKFDYRAGYFCGVMSNDKPIPGSYHEALAAIDANSKELVLQKIMTLLGDTQEEGVKVAPEEVKQSAPKQSRQRRVKK